MMRACCPLPSSSFVPFDFEAHGWEDFAGDRHRELPPVDSSPEQVAGFYVKAHNDETGETHWFWAFVGGPFESWDDWLDYIGTMMIIHGMELA